MVYGRFQDETALVKECAVFLMGGDIILAPAQDVLFALILWYVAKSIFRSQEQDQFALKNSNLYFDQINLIVHVFIVRYQYYNIHLRFTSFEYYLYFIVFRNILFYFSIISIKKYFTKFTCTQAVSLSYVIISHYHMHKGKI